MQCPPVMLDKIHEGNSLDLMKCLKDDAVDLIITSPPYAGKRAKDYNTIGPDEYVKWFMPFASEMKRVIKPDGSFVLNIKEKIIDGQHHPYVFDLVKEIQKSGWRWNETFIWKKENPYPIKPVKRFKDSFEYVFHFTKSPDFKFFPETVMVDSRGDTCARYQRSVNTAQKRGLTDFIEKDRHDYYRRNVKRLVNQCKDGKVKVFPGNVLTFNIGSNRSVNGVHNPAMFPKKLPSFFIDVFTKPGDIVLDPFAGGGTTNVAAKEKCRKTIGFDLKPEYVKMANERLKLTESTCDA
jgi:site-specific DNA-methyltransferase (cytosine-N4-specific)